LFCAFGSAWYLSSRSITVMSEPSTALWRGVCPLKPDLIMT
jgi:hypothetical protein